MTQSVFGAADLAASARRWLVDRALPLWAGAGWDADLSLFHERLLPDRLPDAAAPRRLMVQARQVSVMASASADGFFPGGAALALAAGERMVDAYHRRDGAAGWIFSIDASGAAADGRRDLYAHAFVLFALAHLHRLHANGGYDGLAHETLAFLDERMAAPGGGYLCALPAPDRLRRQNPHMHLLEALQELHAATEDERFAERARDLTALALARFVDAESGALREVFHEDWSVHPVPGGGCVEPGHQFEWAWLLRRQARVSPDDGQIDRAADLLVEHALAHGIDTRGRVVDEVSERGLPVRTTSRLWPHCEAIKCLAVEHQRGRAGAAALCGRVIHRLRERYIPDALAGGWVDQLNEHDRPTSIIIPASSLYHLYGAITQAGRVFPGGSTSNHGTS